MGARQSKRSVDITTTPKKGENETAAVSEDKIEKLGDADVEVVTNGTATHTDIEFADKDEAKEAKETVTTEVKENGVAESSDGEKTPDTEAATAPAAGDQPPSTETTVEKIAENGEKTAETPDAKKPKDKKKKKWSLRSISFSKKDKSKPGKEKEKNGEVEEVNEEKEEETPKTPEEVKPEESKEVEEEKADVAKTEEVAVKTPAVEAPATEAKEEEPVVTPNEQVTVEATKEEEKPKPVELEETTKPEKVEETTIVPSEEVKEVRNEELLPPLPSSNPPSQVAVFAESLKDNVISSNETTSSPVVESQCPSEPQPVTVEAPVDLELKAESVIEPSESTAKLESPPKVEDAVTPTEKESPPVEASVIESSESGIKTEACIVEASESAAEPESSLVETAVIEVSKSPTKTESSEEKSVMEVSESAIKKESPPVEIIESSPEISEPSNESLPDISSKNPSEEVLNNECPEEIPETPSVVPSVEEVNVTESESQNDSDETVESSELREEERSKLSKLCDIDISSAGDSPPFVFENLSNVSSNTTTNESDTSNLTEADSKLEIKVEDHESSESVSSVPVVIEEQLPVVSSGGDMPNPPVDSQTSLELSEDDNLQELKSNLNLKESQESNQCSEEPSIDLSTIPESVESSASKLAEQITSRPELSSPVNETTNSIVEPLQDSTKVETLCNADSLADLSTESLPSLPEPTDSVLEPMSLPPLDFLPDPLVDDNLPVESLDTKPNETEPEVVLTNGNSTNGLKSSPTADDDESPPLPPPDGPLKQQVVAPEPSVGACEISQSTEEKADTVESVQSEAQ